MVRLYTTALVFFSWMTPATVGAAAIENVRTETEAGVIVVTGNSSMKTYSAKSRTDFKWAKEKNEFRVEGRYLNGFTGSIESARRWLLGLRYGRKAGEVTSLFIGQNMESDVFAGFDRQYNTDVGVKRELAKTETLQWSGEAGYRFQSENPAVGPVAEEHFARVFTELAFRYSEFVSANTDLEYLPNFSDPGDYELTGEVALSTTLSSILSFKTGYEVRYRNDPAGGAREFSDTLFTTSIVAKF